MFLETPGINVEALSFMAKTTPLLPLKKDDNSLSPQRFLC